jgi:hypothetical protein
MSSSFTARTSTCSCPLSIDHLLEVIDLPVMELIFQEIKATVTRILGMASH